MNPIDTDSFERYIVASKIAQTLGEPDFQKK